MTFGETLAAAIPSAMAGAALMAVRGAFASRTAIGVRMGEVERRLDIEEGRRAGYAEGYADGAADRKRSNGE